MRPDWRISIKDYRQGKHLRVSLRRLPFGPRQFGVWMDGKRWPADGCPVLLSPLRGENSPDMVGAWRSVTADGWFTAALKPPQSRRWRAVRGPGVAKRLDCGRL
jgi:hypothetical protein